VTARAAARAGGGEGSRRLDARRRDIWLERSGEAWRWAELRADWILVILSGYELATCEEDLLSDLLNWTLIDVVDRIHQSRMARGERV